MATTFAEDMVTKYKALLTDLGGLKSITIDGTSHTYEDLAAKLEYWEKKVARAAGTRPPLSTIGLNGSNF